MWFRNLQVFRLAPEWEYPTPVLEPRLSQRQFVAPSATDRVARGWLPPRNIPGEFVLESAGQQLIALGVEVKLLPTNVVRQYAEEKLHAIEAEQGYRAGRKQVREVREQTELELLPRAFLKRGITYVWIDPERRWLVVDSASTARADEVIEHMKHTLGELPISLIKTPLAPGSAMTEWLSANEVPGRFSIDRDCELKATADDRPIVRYVRHNLDSDDVRRHIVEGKAVTRLALTWNDRVSFVLTEQMQIKRLAFLDILKEEAERQVDAAEDLMAANFVLMAGELSQMLSDLLGALGGECE